MSQDSAQSPRIGQKVAVENAGIPLVTGANMPPAPWDGLLVYRTDTETFQVYSSNEGAWLDPHIGGSGSGGNKTFVGDTEPAADDIGDLWIKTPENYLHVWDGTNWKQSVDPVAEAAATAASNALIAANQSIYNTALANATEHASHVLTAPKTNFSRSASAPIGKEGDLWLEPVAGKLRMLTYLTWEETTALTPKIKALTVSNLAFYVSSTRPKDVFTGDLLLRDGNKERFNIEQWGSAVGDDATIIDEFSDLRTSYAQAIIDTVTDTLGELTTYFQAADPADTQTVEEGDVWFKTDVNLVLRRDSNRWVQVTDPALVESLNRAADARSIADGKIVSYRSVNASPPLSPSEGDLWTVIDKGNLIRRWDGGAWIDLPSGTGAIVPGTIGRTELGTSVKEQIDAALASDGLPPSSAPGVEIVSGVSGTIFLRMTAPVNPDPITGYTIWMSKVSSFTGSPSTLYASNAPSLTSLQGLDTDVNYYFYVAANDPDGTGPKSAQKTGKSIKIDPDHLAQDVLDAIADAGNAADDAQTDATQAIQDALDAFNAAGLADGKAVTAQGDIDDLLPIVDSSVKGYVTEFSVNTSETSAPTTGWSTTTPTRTPGKFIWQRVTVNYNDATSSTTSPALLTGNTGSEGPQGDTGADSTVPGPIGPQGPQGSQGIPGSAGSDGDDGITYYTWLKYATTPTTGMSDSPTGKAYIGLAYNKLTSTESSTYGDYQWSLVKGEDGATGSQGPQGNTGVAGPAGSDGQPTYTWIKYGTSAAGANLSDDPAGKTYIGLAFNKTTATESNTAASYTWSLIQGPQGPQGSQGIAGSAGSDGTDATTYYTWLKYADSPTSGMSDSPTGKAYIGLAYNKTVITESSTYGDYSWSLVKGADGAKGATGSTGATGSGGAKGDTGVAGPAGADGEPTFTWIKYGTSSAGAGFSDSPTGKTYIGFAFNKTTASESSTPGDYTWSLIQGPQGVQGPQGSQGIPGPTGSNGQPTYTWLKYATTPTTGMSDLPTGKTYMGIAYNKTTPTESSTYADYEWSLIRGADGAAGAKGATGSTGSTGGIGPQGNQGIQGPIGPDGNPTYTWIKYGTSSSGAGFSDDPAGKTYIGIAYNKTTQTESNTASLYEWSLIQGPQGTTGATGGTGAKGTTGSTGATGVSITSVVSYYNQTTVAASAPAAPTTTTPPSPWTTTEPTYAANTALWRTERIGYSNSAFAYTAVSKVSSYTAAKAEADAALAAAKAETDRLASRGTDLVVNGTGSLGDNTNFSQFTFNSADAPTGAAGSFVSPPVSGTFIENDYLPVSVTKNFKYSYWIRQTGTPDDARAYAIALPMDTYKNTISPQSIMYQPNTLTTLTQELKSGDTVVHLASVDNFYGTAAKPAGGLTYLRTIVWWDYTDPGGKLWGPETYSRNYAGANYWADGAVNTTAKTITLNAPYSGPTRPVGTKLSNGSSGGTYMYPTGQSSFIVSKEWTQYSGSVTGKTQNGAGASFATGWPDAVAYVKVGWLLNRTTTGATYAGSQMAVAGVSFSDASAAQETADSKASPAEVAAAKSQAIVAAKVESDKKGKVIIQSAAPDAEDRLPQNLWIDTTGGKNIPKKWSSGSTWVAVQDASIQAAANAAVAAQSKANAAAAAATTAQSTADGKNSNTFSGATSAPSTSGRKEGDIHSSVSSGKTVKQWVLTSGAWLERKIDGATLTNLDATTITTGFLNVAILIKSGAIQATQIASNSITTLQLHANSVTINELVVTEALVKSLVAEMMTSETFRTSTSGQRVQIDSTDGLVGYNASGKKVTQVGTDGLLKAIGGSFSSSDLTQRLEVNENGLEAWGLPWSATRSYPVSNDLDSFSVFKDSAESSVSFATVEDDRISYYTNNDSTPFATQHIDHPGSDVEPVGTLWDTWVVGPDYAYVVHYDDPFTGNTEFATIAGPTNIDVNKAGKIFVTSQTVAIRYSTAHVGEKVFGLSSTLLGLNLDIASGKSDDLFVAGRTRNVVYHYTSAGTNDKSYTVSGVNFAVKGIDVDDAGNLYVLLNHVDDLNKADVIKYAFGSSTYTTLFTVDDVPGYNGLQVSWDAKSIFIGNPNRNKVTEYYVDSQVLTNIDSDDGHLIVSQIEATGEALLPTIVAGIVQPPANARLKLSGLTNPIDNSDAANKTYVDKHPALRLTSDSDASLSSTDHALQIGPDNGSNLRIDNNEIMSVTNGVKDTLYLNNDGGPIRLGAGGSGNTLVSMNAYDNTYGSAANMYITGYGTIGRSTSSRRYKYDIKNARPLPDVLNIRPVSFVDKRERNDIESPRPPMSEMPRHFGAIAEEVHDLGLTEFVDYNPDGEPDSIQYDRIAIALIPIIKEQQARLAALEARLDALDNIEGE